jgi:predicted HicB family RNase H-like nuclease
MQYRGYVAEIAYDESVDLLHGHVVNAGPYPIATFEASDVEGLKREFETSIEVYLTACKEELRARKTAWNPSHHFPVSSY